MIGLGTQQSALFYKYCDASLFKNLKIGIETSSLKLTLTEVSASSIRKQQEIWFLEKVSYLF